MGVGFQYCFNACTKKPQKLIRHLAHVSTNIHTGQDLTSFVLDLQKELRRSLLYAYKHVYTQWCNFFPVFNAYVALEKQHGRHIQLILNFRGYLCSDKAPFHFKITNLVPLSPIKRV